MRHRRVRGGEMRRFDGNRRGAMTRAALTTFALGRPKGGVGSASGTKLPTTLPVATTSFFRKDDGLTGTIPTELGWLTELTVFGVPDNSLTGTLPSELGHLRKVVAYTPRGHATRPRHAATPRSTPHTLVHAWRLHPAPLPPPTVPPFHRSTVLSPHALYFRWSLSLYLI